MEGTGDLRGLRGTEDALQVAVIYLTGGGGVLSPRVRANCETAENGHCCVTSPAAAWTGMASPGVLQDTEVNL